ncbi:hypothetical protein HUG10_13360 [Halorarum halophilum]|uniref:Uncharacterized protein n=1 Tax=Halorarum halophilum TaxID=2743090 RepID=A0A7D5KGP3_9EURY|nr:hypothetical protein [Halobaculum halophilum]QLG28476.1 hypothetical protein HUG10_13360 [Halobaculum halophilum]
MVPPRTGEHDRPTSHADGPAETDGGTDPGFDEAALYVVVREAVEDAILGAIGTLMLVGVSFVLIGMGFTTAFETGDPAGAAVGALMGLLGLYVAASTLELVPPVSEWL